MDSASVQFVLFGLTAAVVSNFSRSPIWRSAVLLMASLVFVALLARDPMSLLPVAGFLILGYAGLILMERGWAKSLPWGIVGVALAYVWLKKYTFLPQATFLKSSYFTVGLSYIFFRVLHLLIEAGGGIQSRRTSPFAYLLYMLNFTTFVSGPIQQYSNFAADQFASKPITLGPRTVGLQLERIVRGYFKVNVLAMLLHGIHDDALAQVSQPLPLGIRAFAALRLAIGYPLFLYANFSGYVDIVIALARLMRVRLPENFDRPFAASSVLEFWNRWHMTLSNWLKSYVYNPLLMVLMRRVAAPSWQPFLGVVCFFVTFFLIGVWHGRTSEFIVFGLLTGGGMSINKFWQLTLAGVMGRKGYKELANNSIYVTFCRGLNFVWFAFTLFWFWAGWKQMAEVFSALTVPQWLGVWFATWLCMTVVLAAWEWLRAMLMSIGTAGEPMLTSRYARVVYASALGLTALVITVLRDQPAPGIVYKAF